MSLRNRAKAPPKELMAEAAASYMDQELNKNMFEELSFNVRDRNTE